MVGEWLLIRGVRGVQTPPFWTKHHVKPLTLMNRTLCPVGFPESYFSFSGGISNSVPLGMCGRPSGSSGRSSVIVAKTFPSRTCISSAKYASASEQHEEDGASGLIRCEYHSLMVGSVVSHCPASRADANPARSNIPITSRVRIRTSSDARSRPT